MIGIARYATFISLDGRDGRFDVSYRVQSQQSSGGNKENNGREEDNSIWRFDVRFAVALFVRFQRELDAVDK